MEVAQGIEGPNYKTYVDPESRVCHIEYRDRLDASATLAVYQWMADAIRQAGEDARQLRGCLFDFRQVRDFDAATFATASSKSISMRMQMADVISQIPIALLVQNIQQQVMVEASMMLAKQGKNPRVRLLKSVEDALSFFDSFHSARQPADDAPDATGDKSA